MKRYFLSALQVFASALTLMNIIIYGSIWLTLSVLGIVAIPEDVASALTKGQQMINWLIGTPWWVAAGAIITCLCIAVWLMISGVKGLVAQQRLKLEMPQGYMTSGEAKRILDWSEWFRNEWVRERDQGRSEIKTMRSEVTGYLATVQPQTDRLTDSLKQLTEKMIWLNQQLDFKEFLSDLEKYAIDLQSVSHHCANTSALASDQYVFISNQISSVVQKVDRIATDDDMMIFRGKVSSLGIIMGNLYDASAKLAEEAGRLNRMQAESVSDRPASEA